MERNPYSAPESLVADPVTPRGNRPLSVTAALVLLAVPIALSLWAGLGELRGAAVGEYSFVAVVWRAVKITVAIVLCVNIASGRNWARYTQAVIVVSSAVRLAIDYWAMRTQVPAGVTLVTDTNPLEILWWLLPSALGLAALVLLFLPGRRWFIRETVQ